MKLERQGSITTSFSLLRTVYKSARIECWVRRSNTVLLNTLTAVAKTTCIKTFIKSE